MMMMMCDEKNQSKTTSLNNSEVTIDQLLEMFCRESYT